MKNGLQNLLLRENMKNIISILLALTILNAKAFTQTRINPRLNTLFTKKITFVKVKKGFRNLRMKPMALIRGKVNKRKVLLDSSRPIKLSAFGMSKSTTEELQKIVVLCAKNANNLGKVRPQWKKLIIRVATGDVPMDINALIQFVLREAYLENNMDLRFYADKVRFFNEQKDSIRSHLNDQKKSRLNCKRRNIKCSRNTQANIEMEIEKWEQELSSIGDDAQLANIDLQNALQKQQQALQTISNVSKMLHDTAMAVIRKIN